MKAQDNRRSILNKIKEAVSKKKSSSNLKLIDIPKIKREKEALNLVEEFEIQARNVGATVYKLDDVEMAKKIIAGIIEESGSKSVIIQEDTLLSGFDLKNFLKDVEIIPFEQNADPGENRRSYFYNLKRAEVGITGVDFAIADTGSIVLRASDQKPRAVSLLPPIHIAVLKEELIIPSLYELMTEIEHECIDDSCITIITGPSKTADIEFNLVRGIHGPGELHIIILTR